MMTTIRALIICLAVLGVTALAAPAEATTVVELTTVEQAARSDVIAMATVVSAHTFRAEDGLVFTDTVVLVDENLWGTTETQLTIRQFGGELDGVEHVLPGDAELQPGEQVVVFLADRDPGSGVLYLTALAQSKYAVVGRTASGDLLLMPNFHGLVFYDPDVHTLYENEDPTTLTLSALRDSIAEVRGGVQ